MRAGLPHFTEGLNRIVGTYGWRDDSGEVCTYTTATLAEELRRRGFTYSDSYIHQLRTGAKSNPSAVLLAGLCACFDDLDVRYWYDTEVRVQVLRDLDRRMETL